jgi:hypothetical protein
VANGIKPPPNPTGPGNSNWRGGQVRLEGYVMVRAPEHPNALKSGYIMEHRMVMSEVLGRPLEPGEYVHHRNGDKADNRAENLELMVRNPHRGTIECPHCRQTFAIR